MCSRFYSNASRNSIRVNLIHVDFIKRQYPRRSLSRALISVTLISIVLDTLLTFLTPKKEEYNIISRVDIRQ